MEEKLRKRAEVEQERHCHLPVAAGHRGHKNTGEKWTLAADKSCCERTWAPGRNSDGLRSPLYLVCICVGRWRESEGSHSLHKEKLVLKKMREISCWTLLACRAEKECSCCRWQRSGHAQRS